MRRAAASIAQLLPRGPVRSPNPRNDRSKVDLNFFFCPNTDRNFGRRLKDRQSHDVLTTMRDPVLLVTVIEELDDVRTGDVVELATEIAELLVQVDGRNHWLIGRAFALGRDRALS